MRGVREVHGLPVLIVSGIAALVMLAGALLLGDDVDDDEDGPDEDEKLTVRVVLLDTADGGGRGRGGRLRWRSFSPRAACPGWTRPSPWSSRWWSPGTQPGLLHRILAAPRATPARPVAD